MLRTYTTDQLYDNFANFNVDYTGIVPVEYDKSTWNGPQILREGVEADVERAKILCNKVNYLPKPIAIGWDAQSLIKVVKYVGDTITSLVPTMKYSDFRYVGSYAVYFEPNVFTSQLVRPGSSLPLIFYMKDISRLDPSEYKYFTFRLSFEQQDTVISTSLTSKYNRVCNMALGAHWTYNYLISKGFGITKEGDTYVLKYIPPVEPQVNSQVFDSNTIVNNYVAYVKSKYNVVDESTYQSIQYGKGKTFDELVALLNNLANVEAIKRNLLLLMKWKLQEYEKRYGDFNKQLERQAETYVRAGLTKDEVKEISSASADKLIAANIKMAILLVSAHIDKLEKMSAQELRDDYIDGLLNPQNGLTTIIDQSIVDQIANAISTLINGYQAFSTSFQNILITGPAGIGKSTLAYKISYVFLKLHILSTNNVSIVSRSDIVASYLGQTSIKVKKLLFENLEGILFIDEAYQVGGCPIADQYGSEALTELVNFLDKYVGISVVIVAGYEKEMNQCFFERNEGLRRRFPTKYALKPFNSLQLLKVFLTKVLESLGYDPFQSDINNVAIAYFFIDDMKQKGYVPNMGGDMLVLASNFIIMYLSSSDVQSSLINSTYNYCVRDNTVNSCITLVQTPHTI